jgi:predicted NACHT family NTPase
MRVMSKKIDATLKDLTKALENHAKVVGGRTVSLKKSQRAAAKLQATATAYAAAVYSKTGLDSPFNDVVRPGLDAATLASLEAERDALAKTVTGPILQQRAAS